MSHSRKNIKTQAQDLLVQSIPFKYIKYPQTIFVPVYPRAQVQQVIQIDAERRTVTARFLIHITICLQLSNWQLKQFIKEHMILEFGYNQMIYIPELMKMDNPPFIIQKVVEPDQKEDYITYRIKGNLQCSALFDLMFFPYREIDVVNHLVIRSQTFCDSKGRQFVIKYNAMILRDTGEFSATQFSPHFVNS